MALFSRNKTKTVEAETEKKTPALGSKTASATDVNLASVLINPCITEKAVGLTEKQVYTFDVRKDATKYMVRDAVIALYKVTPVKVNIVNKSPRTFMSRSRGKAMSVKGYKKAYVYLKSGDTINLV